MPPRKPSRLYNYPQMVFLLAISLAATTSLATAEPAQGFCVTGLVVHATQRALILQRDDGPYLNILCDAAAPAPGEKAIICGHIEYTRFNEPDYFLSSFKVIAHGRVPPPREVTIADLREHPVRNERISLQAEIEDYFIDDVDTRFYYLSLKSGPHRIYGTVSKQRVEKSVLDDLLGATIRLTGIIHDQHGARPFVGNRIELDALSQEQVLVPAETDLSRLPSLDGRKFSLPFEIARLSRHRIGGTVLATWQHTRILVLATDGRVVGATLCAPSKLPRVGETVIVAGSPMTDFFHLSLVGGKWQPSELPSATIPPAIRLDNNELFTDFHGNHSIDTTYHGKTVCVRGRVMRSGDRELEVDLGRDTIRAHAGEESRGFGSVETGSVIELTGTAILEAGFWREGAPFPRIGGVSIVTRRDDDVIVLHRPPWWTPTKLLIAFLGLAAFIAGLIVWNRLLMRLAARRSRELIREQLAKERSELKTEERTRLAIELHDSLSQNLSGLGCQLVATRLALKSDATARSRLETAERMLLSTRTELKRCLFDLREYLLEDTDFERAVGTMLEPLLGSCNLHLRIHVARSIMDDSVAHAILSIIRELVSNAIRHGHASKVQVAGSLQNGNEVLVSVCDNGIGFDADSCAGPSEGHFGLTGIRDRISRAGGSFRIESTPGRTYARFSIPV